MDKRYLIQLTNDIYRLALLFPKKEPLRYKIKELALDILAKPSGKDLEILDNFLDVALAQNWVSPSDILAIKEKYGNLKEILKESKVEKVEKKKAGNPVALEIPLQKAPVQNNNNPDRKEKIIAFLKDSGKAQVWQVKQVFPEVSKRTLRRDFESMLEKGLIERIGEKNDTFYKIKSI
jgi:Fic family protein